MIKSTFSKIAIILLSSAFLTASFGNSSEPKENKIQIPISTWLTFGPIASPFPVFNKIKNIKGLEFDLKDLLKFEPIDLQSWAPEPGTVLRWDQARTYQWQQVTSDSNGFVSGSASLADIPEICYFVTYIDVKRWTTAKLELSSHHLLQIYVDGKMITEKTSSEKAKDDTSNIEPGGTSPDIKLETGKHILIVKSVRDPENQHSWNLKAVLALNEPWPESDLVIDLSPKHYMTIKDLLDGPKISSASISADGELVALSLRQTLPSGDDSESWIEIRCTNDGRLYQTFRGGLKISYIQWSPVGRRFSYTTSEKEASTLWIVDLDKGTSTPLLENIKDMGGHTWAPNGAFIVYSISEKPESEKSGLKKLASLPDRLPGWRNRSFLYLVNVPEGTRRRLTSGLLTTDLNAISPDCKRLLFSRAIDDVVERPYSKTEVFILDLETMRMDSLWTSRWSGNLQWSPDGKKLLITGAPSMFGDIGVNVPKEMIPNEYDTQAYIYDLTTKKIEAISRYFNPAMGQAIWSKTEDGIYFNTTDKSYRHLYRYDLKQKKFELIETGIEVLDGIDIAEWKPVAIYTGSSAAVPQKAYMIDLKTRKYRLFADPQADDFKQVEFGKIERWTFKNANNLWMKKGSAVSGLPMVGL